MSAINTKVTLDQIVIKSFYYKYKDFILPLSTIFVCIFLFFIVIMPQIQSWFAMRDEISTDSQKLDVLKKNLQIISGLDDTQLNTYLSISTHALPSEKDFAGVLQALTAAANTAGTSLGDYNFQIGDLLGDDANNKSGSQLPLQLTVDINGDLSTGKRFIEALKNQLPLSDVTKVDASANSTVEFLIVFYYVPLPKITFDDSAPLITLSPKNEELLNLLNNNTNANIQTSVVPDASPSSNSSQ